MPEDSRDTNTAAREHLEDGTDRAVAGFDDGVVDVLAWLLDTDTRARIFVYLRQHPYSTSDEVADGTGLYPSTVREAVAELAADSIVDRRKRHAEGAGNNPYEYTAIPRVTWSPTPSDASSAVSTRCSISTRDSATATTTPPATTRRSASKSRTPRRRLTLRPTTPEPKRLNAHRPTAGI